ncbi:MAG: hypothetical protein KAQ85_11740, partial [Thermodesulfovibrionia bacterium]|nr:hypothetical protein [Thermodesulfovibrionia bacterium]
MKKQKPLTKGNVIVKSLKKIKPSILGIMFLDFLSHFTVFSIILIFWKLLSEKMGSISLPESVYSLTRVEIMQISIAVESFFHYIVLLVVVVPLVITLIFGVSRALLWKLSYGDKIKPSYLLKSIPLGLIWFGISGVLSVIILITLRQGFNVYALLFFLLVLIYFSDILFIKYAKEEKINLFTRAIKEGTKRIKDMGLTYVIVAVIALAYYVLSVPLTAWMAPMMANTVNIVIYLFYFAWTRLLL